MFSKAYKVKSNNTLKNSEKKHLAQRIQNEFPCTTEEKVKELVPVKANASCMKVVLNLSETIGVYVVDGMPVIMEIGEQLVPTVCGLWQLPDLLPTITIHSPVLLKMQGGAPLYMPGVVIPTAGIGFPLFQRGAIIAACTQENMAAGVVGRALMSSADMIMRSTGVCMETIQIYGDLLCKDLKFSKINRPKLTPGSYESLGTDDLCDNISQLNIQASFREEWPSLGKPKVNPVPVLNQPKLIADEPKLISDEPVSANVEDNVEHDIEDSIVTESSQSEDEIPVDMDGLLQWCLLSFIKLEGKHLELPLKTNLLYKNHLMPLCPADRTLDVKKSSYKKMSKFLEAMQQEGLLEVREVEKGVAALVALSVAHPLVRAHRQQARPEPAAASSEDAPQYAPPRVREMLCITAAVADLFAPLKKGTALTPAEVRVTLTEYVRTRSLNATQTKGAVTLDALLAKITGKQEQENMKWDMLMSAVQAKMTSSTEMCFADGSVRLAKSKLEPVRMQVATRSGNKKVTLVSNLEQFGFSLPPLSAECQRGAAASCCVTTSPALKGQLLQLQGDQTYFVAKLLIEKFGLPKKFVEGADKALKKKRDK